MLSHLLRFSVFLVVIMTSFAVTFFAIFSTCRDSDDVVELNDIGKQFKSVSSSLLFTFDAMLGSPGFDLFKDESCAGSDWNTDVGVLLLVVYLVIMAVLLLNLLIAVLSTVHSDMNRNAEMEFHLARTQIIMKSARWVSRDRTPPPLNVIMAVLGLAVDLVGEICFLVHKLCR